ncbi:MAG: retroviral-like aspartic protease [Chamaesiphon sp. CSU_1_12]|nr:retroviral-like aspartic protease [Chamaesiphon sp. CSU_1_12]
MLEFDYTITKNNSPIPAINFYFANPDNPLLTCFDDCSILDTGSDVTIISYSIASKLLLKSIKRAEPLSFRGFGRKNIGVPYRILGSFNNKNYFSTKVFAIEDDVLNGEVIIGRNILNRYIITFNGLKLFFTISP